MTEHKSPNLSPPRCGLTTIAAVRCGSLRPMRLAYALLLSALSGVAAAAGMSPSSEATSATVAQPVAQAEAPSRSGQSPSRVTAQEPDTQAVLPPNILTRELMFQLLAAEIAAQRGQFGSAVTTYLSVAKSTRDPRLAQRATELAMVDRSLERAVQAAQLWYELAPDSPRAGQTIEALWLSSGRFREAEPLVLARLEKARSTAQLAGIYGQLQRLLVGTSDKAGALSFIEKVSLPDDKIAEARMAVAAVADQAGQFDRAAAEATVAIKLSKDDPQTAVSAAEYIAKTPLGKAGAADLLSSYLQRNPKASDVRISLAQLLAADGKSDAAKAQIEQALKEEPESPSMLYLMAQLTYQSKQPAAATQYLKRYLALPATIQRDNTQAYLFLAQIAEEDNRFEEAIGHLKQVQGGEQFLAAVTRRAVLLGKLKRVDEARELLRTSNVSTARERSQLTSAEAQVLRDAQRYTEAFDVLDQALTASPGNAELLYDHAMAAEKVDKMPVLESSLRKLIELRPDNAHAYNALGYTWADRNMRLDEAKAMIEKALTLAPEDSHIIDSMGWVLYRLGNLDKAVEWLEKAWKLRPEVEVAAHLGEVLWKAGRTAEARKMWQEAQRLDPASETLKETLARLNVAL